MLVLVLVLVLVVAVLVAVLPSLSPSPHAMRTAVPTSGAFPSLAPPLPLPLSLLLLLPLLLPLLLLQQQQQPAFTLASLGTPDQAAAGMGQDTATPVWSLTAVKPVLAIMQPVDFSWVP